MKSTRGNIPTGAPPGQGLARVMANLASLRDVQVTAGIQSADGAKEEDGTTLLTIAAANHYGTDDGHIPPRPWLTGAEDQHHGKWRVMASKVVQARGRMETGEQELRQLAVVMVGDCKESLLDGDWRENAEETIRRKGSDQPLFDTGRLNQSQRAQVEIPGEAPIVVG